MQNAEKNFYFSMVLSLCSCTGNNLKLMETDIENLLVKNDSSAQEIFYVFNTAKAIGYNISKEFNSKIGHKLQAALKLDDSLNSIAHVFYVASEIGIYGEFALKRIEGTIAQADEIDGKYLQFEGGLSITAAIIIGSFKLSDVTNKSPPVSEEQATKLANYFLSRRSVQTVKGISYLLETLKLLTNHTSVSPICITLIGNGRLKPEYPILEIKFSNVFGEALEDISGATFSVSSIDLAKKIVKESDIDKIDGKIYKLNLKEHQLSGGHYSVNVALNKYKQEFLISILQNLDVEYFEIMIIDVESNSVQKRNSILYPEKCKEIYAVDAHQKISIKMSLKDRETRSLLTLHQVFIGLKSVETREEIIFVAEQDSSKTYKFDMDISSRGIDFSYKNGLYTMDLFIGDSLISYPFEWQVGEVNIKFSHEANTQLYDIKRNLPEIQHRFKTPEKLPLRVVSYSFAFLTMIPLLVLIVVWGRTGVNKIYFPFSVNCILFHFGLLSIFALYGSFWLRLNMFETLKYLTPIGFITLITGNELLRKIATHRLGVQK